MIERYTRPRMKAIWDLRHKYEIWLDVELLACEALEQTGEVPRGVSARARKKACIDVGRIAKIEQVVKHDVIAFLESLAKSVDSGWVLRAIAGFDELYAGARRNLNRQLGLDALAASLAPDTF